MGLGIIATHAHSRANAHIFTCKPAAVAAIAAACDAALRARSACGSTRLVCGMRASQRGRG
jgi:hypothetical protein